MDNQIVLTDKDGNEVTLEFLDTIEYKGDDYVMLLPPGEVTVLILKAELQKDGTDALVPVRDEQTLDTVFNIFRNRNKEAFAAEE